MQYQVLARKWRPQNFSELVGQSHVSRTLLNALKSNRVAHAFLFSGPRGSGKTTTARILAKALNCHEGKPGEPCGRCPACLEIAAGNCMDVLEIDAASHGLVDDVRDLMERVQYQPARDRKKIYIIDEAHMVSGPGFNALLKTLEEPPAHVIFILATTEYHKMPVTILSRCQHHLFKLIPYDLILERLCHIAQAESFEISRTALQHICFASGGSMRDAMTALDQVIAFSGPAVRDEDVMMLLSLIEPAVLGETIRAIAKNDAERILMVVSGLVDAGQDLQNFCKRLVGHFRNLMVVKAGVVSPSLLGVPESLVPDLKEQAALFSAEDLLRMFEAMVRIESSLKYAVQTRFHLEMGLVELAQLSRLRPLEELIAEFNRLARSDAGSPDRSPLPQAAGANPRAEFSARPSSPGRIAVAPPKRATREPERPPVAETAPSSPAPEPEAAQRGGVDPRRLLLEISGAVQKESLEPILQSLAGARVHGRTVVLDLGGANDFVRRQLNDNLDVIARAASTVTGAEVKVTLEQSTAAADRSMRAAEAGPPPGADAPEDVLERAKQDPVVRAFLEVFPGPVRAEKDGE